MWISPVSYVRTCSGSECYISSPPLPLNKFESDLVASAPWRQQGKGLERRSLFPLRPMSVDGIRLSQTFIVEKR